jgi:hypothetical protein
MALNFANKKFKVVCDRCCEPSLCARQDLITC